MTDGFDSSALLSIRNRVIVVTGGGKGIGRVYCERMAEAGARVVVADIDAEANDDTVAAIRAAGGEALACATDVSDAGQAERMARTAIDGFGRIDGLLNNASLMSVLPRGDWMEIDVERWDRVMEVNLRGIFVCCRAVALATEVGPDNICVNAITPGFTLSDTQVASSGDYAQRNEPPPGRIIRRHQYPDDLVGAVMFLMSPGSDFITGQTINVDGGQSMH